MEYSQTEKRYPMPGRQHSASRVLGCVGFLILKKTIFAAFVSVLILSCSGSKTQIHGSNNGFLGIVKDNVLSIYKFSNKWIIFPDRSFTLRPKDKIIYFDSSFIVLQRDRTLKFNSFNKGWAETEGGFILPDGFKNALYGRSGNNIYLVKDNAIRAYDFNHSSWDNSLDNFLLPPKYRDLFLFTWIGHTALSVAGSEGLQFYELDGNGLSKNIVGFSPEQKHTKFIPYFQSIGVVEKDVISFYQPSYDDFEDQKWLYIPEMDFQL